MYTGHRRIIDYVEDSCRTFANICDRFKPEEVYNVGGRPGWEKDIKEYSDRVLNAVGKDHGPLVSEVASSLVSFDLVCLLSY